jgi:hypothetical protein
MSRHTGGRHLIDTLTVDIGFDRPGGMLQDEAWLSALFRGTLLPIVDALLDQYDQPGLVLALPRVDLDLGVLTQGEFASEVPQRLRTALDAALRQLVPAAWGRAGALAPATEQDNAPANGQDNGQVRRAPPPAPGVHSAAQAALANLLQFLKTGRLPWHADARARRSHETLLEEVLAAPPGTFWPALARTLQQPSSLQRLVVQYPPRLLLALVHSIAAPQAQSVAALVAELGVLVHAMQAGSLAPGSTPQLAWRTVLATAARQPGISVALRLPALCGAIVDAIAAAAGQDGAALRRQWARAQDAPIAASLLRELAAEGGAAPANLDALAALAAFLASGRWPHGRNVMPVRDAAVHHALLAHLLEHAGAQLRKLMVDALASPASARRLVQQFPAQQLRQLIAFGAPGRAAALGALIDSLRDALPSTMGTDAVVDCMALAWQHVLAAAFLDEGKAAPALDQLRAAIVAGWPAHPEAGVHDPALPSRSAAVRMPLAAATRARAVTARPVPVWRPVHAAQSATFALLRLLDAVAAQRDGAISLPAPALTAASRSGVHRTVLDAMRPLERMIRAEALALERVLRRAQVLMAPDVQPSAAAALPAPKGEQISRHVAGAASDAGSEANPAQALPLPDAAGTVGAPPFPGDDALRQAALAALDASATIGAARRTTLAASIDAAAALLHDRSTYWRAVTAVLSRGAVLDLDAIVAQADRGGADGLAAARAGRDEGALRQAALAALDASAAISPARHTTLVAGIDAAAALVQDRSAYWRAVTAVLSRGAVLDLDAIVAQVDRGGADDLAPALASRDEGALRQAALAALDASAAISPARRTPLAASIDAAAAFAHDRSTYWRAVTAVLSRGAVLDLDAIVAQVDPGGADALAPADAGGDEGALRHMALAASAAIGPASGPMLAAGIGIAMDMVMATLASGALLDLAGIVALVNREYAGHLATGQDGGQDTGHPPSGLAGGAVVGRDTIVAQAARGRGEDLASGTDEGTLRQAVRAHLDAGSAIPTAMRILLAASMDMGAAQAHDRRAYWHAVLATVARSRVVDVAVVEPAAPVDARDALAEATVPPQAATACMDERIPSQAAGFRFDAGDTSDIIDALDPAHRARLAAGTDAAAAQAPGQAAYWRHVAAVASTSAAADPQAIVATARRGAAQDPAPATWPQQGGAPAPATVQVGDPPAFWRLRQALVQALLSGDHAPLLPGWRRLLHSHAPLLRQALLQYGPHPRVRRGLARSLPDAMLLDLVHLLAPVLHRVAGVALRMPAPFGHGSGERIALWEALLAAALPASAPAPEIGLAGRLLHGLCGGDGARYLAFLQAWLAAEAGRQHAQTHPAPGAYGTAVQAVDAALPPAGGAAPDAQDAAAGFDAWLLALAEQRHAAGASAPEMAAASPVMAAIMHVVDAHFPVPAPPDRLIERVLATLRATAAPQDGAQLARLDEHAALAVDPARYRADVAQRYRDDGVVDLAAPLLGQAAALPLVLVTEAAEAEADRTSQAPAAAVAVALPPEPAEALYVANAGMVLAAPYLPRLFGVLGLLEEGVFVDAAAAGRAVHLLQYMVTGEAATPEYALILNKLLCGLETSVPVPAGIEVTPREQETIEGMLRAMIAHWKTIGSTSIAGLRQSFLKRAGVLRLDAAGWHLAVAPGSFDMLLDCLPWSFALIKPAWMALPLHVTWRQAPTTFT